ncbi:glycoside hydrolase family 30 protein [Pseudalkalibacillus hwajinpoensis]|uniref:Glucosylceramidase n=1 Tax=Guptibacillus hwajinpoensis TaxID=208199 RepID=A0A4U1MBX4_9BACL|nr:glycoside hydrolase family 30 protein [Pseudalkalibacillus hwajinpoensis]TKD68257.1 glucosylceramidase [Pseudalkalibacillus hwajinpoensis]
MKTKTITHIQSARDNGDLLKVKEPLQVSPLSNADATQIKLDPKQTYQTILGFGGAFTEASAYTLSLISEEKRNEIIHRYFHPEEGLGYRFGRTHINSCDFSLGNYTYVEENDTSLSTFSIEREQELVIPLIKDATKVAGDNLSIVSSPWSPPPWMKSNNEMNHGGKLLPEYNSVWADYYIKYVDAMEAEGIPIWGLTIQNEPEAKQVWDSCLYTAEEERDFIKNHLGPAIRKNGRDDLKVIIWDHNRDVVYERASKVLSDPEAAQYVWGTGLHWYVSEEFENLSKVHNAFPDKHLIFTEGCIEGGVQLGAWHTGERYARNIMGDLNNYLEAWIDWNIVLNEEGGPNHVGNYCDAPVIVDTKSGEVYYNSSFYYIGHFSKYVKPGAVRIGCTSVKEDIQSTSFRNESGEIVVILMNENDEERAVNLEIEGQNVAVTMPAHSISTVLI